MQCFTDINEIWRIWENKCPININEKGLPLNIVGWSQGSLRTNFLIKNANISLDAGLSCPYSVDNVLLTHGHCDHSASLFFYCLRQDKFIDSIIDGKKVKVKVYLKIYVPEELAAITDMKLQCDFAMTNSIKKERNDTSYQIIGVKHGDSIPTIFMGTDSTFDIFRCYHGNIPCVGYGITTKVKKIKDEYKNLTNEEKKQLGKKKIQLMEFIDYSYFLYLGDTDNNILKENPDIPEVSNNNDLEISWRVKKSNEIEGYKQHNKKITDFKYIMIECNFLIDEHYNEAIIRNHMHWIDIKKFANDNPNNIIILYHFSMRYKSEQIDMFFNDPKNQKPDNIYWWNSK